MATRQNSFHGPAFPTTRCKTQGGLVSLTLFNVVVNNVIRIWLDMTVEDQRVAHDKMGETIGRCLAVFYAENGMVVSHESEWLQNEMNVLVGIFRSYGLETNVAKSCRNDMPARHITGGDVGGGHGAEVNGGGILVPSETPKADTMPGVFI